MTPGLGRALLTLGALGLFAWLLVAVVRAAKRGGKRMHAVGAMLMLFGWGNLRDPSDNPVAEAREGRARRGQENADPTDPSDGS